MTTAVWVKCSSAEQWWHRLASWKWTKSPEMLLAGVGDGARVWATTAKMMSGDVVSQEISAPRGHLPTPWHAEHEDNLMRPS